METTEIMGSPEGTLLHSLCRRSRILGAVVFYAAVVHPGAAEIRFEEANNASGVLDTGETVGAAWGDVDGNGYPDIWLDKHQFTPTMIYLNRGDGTFGEFIEDASDPSGILDAFEVQTDSHGRAWADIENDGDEDILEVSDLTFENLFWVNRGDGTFENRMASYGFQYPFDAEICSPDGNCNPFGRRMPLWLDYDRDGRLDVMVTALIDYAGPFSPTAVFKQTTTRDGEPLFEYAAETGVVYEPASFCRYAMMAELTGDDTLDVICLDSGRVTRAWDTSRLPFLDLRESLGESLFADGVMDLAIGDFDGDLRSDVFAARANHDNIVVDQIDDRTVHARFQTPQPGEGEFSFSAEGDLLIDFDWWAAPRKIFIGDAGVHPPESSNLHVFEGWNNHVQIRLSPSDPAAQGISGGSDAGHYIGFVDGRWRVRLVTDVSDKHFQHIIQAGVAITDLRVERNMRLGQRADRRPALMGQDESHRLVDHSDKVKGPPNSCVAAVEGDFDNDGDLDVYLACSGTIRNLDNILYENDGAGNFTARTGSDLGPARGDLFGRAGSVSTADYDLDGRLDLFVTNGLPFKPFSLYARQQLFRNLTENNNHWVQIDLEGVLSNRNAIGARVFATTPDGKVQLREQDNGMHRDAQDFRRLHFGLGSNTHVDLEIRWPSGIVDRFPDLAADALYELREGTGSIDQPAIACGTPTYDAASERGVFIYYDCSHPHQWHVRVTGGGAVTSYSGVVTSNEAFVNLSAVSQEPSDGLSLAADGRVIGYLQNVAVAGWDGFDFQLAEGGSACFSLDLPVDLPVQLGVDRVSATSPVNLTGIGFCGPGIGTLSVADLEVDEGGGPALIRVVLSVAPQAGEIVQVAYRLTDMTATAGVDYIPNAGTLTFLEGETRKTVPVEISDDPLMEPAEGFFFSLSEPVNAILARGTATVAIQDDDVSVVACGVPDYDGSTERAAFLYRDCASPDQWSLRFTPGGIAASYQGTVRSSQAFTGLVGMNQEGNDSLSLNEVGDVISYVQGVGGSGYDGFDFGVAEGASVCVDLHTPSGIPLYLGRDRLHQETRPFDLETLGICRSSVAVVPL